MDLHIKEEPDVIVLDEDDCPFTIVTVKIGENGAIEETNEPVINLDPEIHSTNNPRVDDSSETDNSDDWTDDTGSPADAVPIQPKAKRKRKRERRFTCQYCGLAFNQAHHLQDHVMTHTGEQPFKCTLCNKRFIQRSNLNRHICQLHPSDAPRLIKDRNTQSYNCWDCNESFSTQSDYMKHTEFHRNAWTLKQKASLQLGETSAVNQFSDSDGQSDAAEIAYSCAFCDQEYPDEESLATHMSYHRGAESPNDLICEDKPTEVRAERRRKEQKQRGADEFLAPRIRKSFSCEYCGKQCGNELKLSYHERTHRIVRSFHCSICRRGFNNRQKYERHVKTHSTRPAIEREHQQEQEAEDSPGEEKIYDCKYCGKQFDTKLTWSYHERTHRIRRKFRCSVCKKGFNIKQVYEEHMKQRSCKPAVQIEDLEEEETGKTSFKESLGPPLSCRFCGKECTTKMNLSYHERTHKIKRSFQCTMCRRGFNNEQAYNRHLHSHSLREEMESLSCKYCGKKCKTKLSLSYHERTHKIDRTFRCSICRRGFDSKLAYDRHIRQHQRGEESVYYAKPRPNPKPVGNTDHPESFISEQSLSEQERTPAVQMAFSCSVCNKGFNRRQTYERHIKIHSAKPMAKTEQLKEDGSDIYSTQRSLESFMCIYCGKECGTKLKLSYHERTHRIKRTFHCSLCKKSFDKRQVYIRHLKKHSSKPAVNTENEEGEGLSPHVDEHTVEAILRPFTCKECGSRFTARQYLVRHLNSHACGGFRCKFCGRKFTSKASWAVHMRTHTVPYSCSVCNEKFKIPGQLAVHMKILHGIKNSEPFSCSVCHNSFASLDTLRLHMAEFHKEIALELFNDEDSEARSSKIKTPFSCSVCKIGFDNRQTYEEHLETHSSTAAVEPEHHKDDGLSSDMDNFSEETCLRPFSCEECGARFTGRQYLARHMQTHSKLKFSCKFCAKKFTLKSSWVMHMKTHTVEMPYSCSVCNEKFKIPGRLAEHMKTHGIKNSEPFSCSVCHNTFSNIDTLQLHMAEFHKKVAQELFYQGRGSMRPSYLEEPHAKRHFYCSLCNKGFNKSQAYDQHVRSHSASPGNAKTESQKEERTPFRCKDCGVHFSKQVSLDHHMRTHKIKYEFPCSMCNRKFSRKESFEEHMRMHAGHAASSSTSGSDEETQSNVGEIIFDCPLCDNEFTTAVELKAHLDEHETKDLPKSFTCNKCGARFMKKQQLESHKEIHNVDKVGKQSSSGETGFSCTVCNKSFESKSKLEGHAEIHTKPFRCAICRQRCPSESALRTHMECHGEDKVSFECEDCGKRYSSKAGLFYHKISHNKKFRQTFRCSVCNAGFNRRLAYDWHVKMHCSAPTAKTAEHVKGEEGGERSGSFSCQFCGETFDESASLETHRRTHETNYSFTCSICQRGFKKKDVFELHMKTHEEEAKTDLDNEEDFKRLMSIS